MDAEPPSPPDGGRRVGEDRIAGWCPDGFSNPLGDDEDGGGLPPAGDGEERDGAEQAVAGRRRPPVVVVFADVDAGGRPQGIPDELAGPGDQPDDCRAPPEEEDIGAGDASGTVRDAER